MMGGVGILFALIVWGLGIVILIAVIRYAIDCSKTSQKLDQLIYEISLLRKDLKETHNNSIIDKKI